MRSIEIFSGCGALAYGTSEAGFRHEFVLELDGHACATVRLNADRGVRHFKEWPVREADVRSVDFAKTLPALDLVSGGPPCQPFSMGGKHKGPTDQRNMWPEAIRAVHENQPRAFLFENVRGLLRPAFSDYLEFIRLSLSWPELYMPGEAWERQLKRLRAHAKKNSERPSYRVSIQAVNAADYGAAQKRHRAIVWGVRADVTPFVDALAPSHSREALIWSQYVTGEYWERHQMPRRSRTHMTNADRSIYDRLVADGVKPIELPWVTVRDVIADLPRPTIHSETVTNHRLHPGARAYKGHTGSAMDEPAKALKAGCHGVPGGENILITRNRGVRYFTVREMMRLQGLPDAFCMDNAWLRATKQLGNAVPVQVGRAFSSHIARYLNEKKRPTVIDRSESSSAGMSLKTEPVMR